MRRKKNLKRNRKRKKRRKNGQYKTFKGTFLKILAVFFLGIFLFSLSAVLYFISPLITDDKSYSPESLYPPVASKIMDRGGEKISQVNAHHRRREISIDEIPEHVVQAFVVVEDRRFYQHSGVDLYAVVRALWANLKQIDWSYQGGSTITQQLVRNAFLSREQTLKRKVQEIWLALQVERYYVKEEILEMYLNYIYFGEGAYGIEKASRTYFGKGASELTKAEAALLAGIIRAPNYYSPFKNKEAALSRQHLVLEQMKDADYIPSNKWEEERQRELEFAGEFNGEEEAYRYYTDYVVHHELIEILAEDCYYGSEEKALEAINNEGLQVYTTIDTELQDTAEEVLSSEELYPSTVKVDISQLHELEDVIDEYPEKVKSKDGIAQPQSALVAADPQTGGLLALVGGREYQTWKSSLRFMSTRQPGSAIKPILAYVPALETKGYHPATVIDDSPIVLNSWAPENFDRQFRGLTTVREALVYSLNVPAVKTFEAVGPDTALKYGKKMGIDNLESEDASAASVLGGMPHGISPKEIAQAYAVLANNGVKNNLHAVTKIKDRNGQLIYQRKNRPEIVLKQNTAYLVNNMLEDVVDRGTGRNINAEAFTLAAKTGTSNENRDAWLAAYSPNIVISLWMGHDFPRYGKISDGSGSVIPLVNEILAGIEEDYLSHNEFEKPPMISKPLTICRKSGKLPGADCPSEDLVKEIFPRLDVPLNECGLHVKKEVCKESGGLVSKYCPEEKVEEKTYLKRPDYKVTDERWKFGPGRRPLDAGMEPPGEECDEHQPSLNEDTESTSQ